MASMGTAAACDLSGHSGHEDCADDGSMGLHHMLLMNMLAEEAVQATARSYPGQCVASALHAVAGLLHAGSFACRASLSSRLLTRACIFSFNEQTRSGVLFFCQVKKAHICCLESQQAHKNHGSALAAIDHAELHVPSIA